MHALRTTAAARGYVRPAPDVLALLKRYNLLHYWGRRGGQRKQRAITVITSINGQSAASNQLTAQRVRNARHRLVKSRARRCKHSFYNESTRYRSDQRTTRSLRSTDGASRARCLVRPAIDNAQGQRTHSPPPCHHDVTIATPVGIDGSPPPNILASVSTPLGNYSPSSPNQYASITTPPSTYFSPIPSWRSPRLPHLYQW